MNVYEILTSFSYLGRYSKLFHTVKVHVYTHFSDQHLIDEHPKPPPVHCSGVRCVSQDLRGQKLRGPTESAGPVSITHSLEKVDVQRSDYQTVFSYVETFYFVVGCNEWTITFFTESKVCYLHKSLGVQQQVVQFKVPIKRLARHGCTVKNKSVKA